MSEPTRSTAPAGVFPAARYTHVVTATGRLVAVSGQFPLDKDGELVGAGDPAAQARQVFVVTDMTPMPAVRTARAALPPAVVAA